LLLLLLLLLPSVGHITAAEDTLVWLKHTWYIQVVKCAAYAPRYSALGAVNLHVVCWLCQVSLVLYAQSSIRQTLWFQSSMLHNRLDSLRKEHSAISDLLQVCTWVDRALQTRASSSIWNQHAWHDPLITIGTMAASLAFAFAW